MDVRELLEVEQSPRDRQVLRQAKGYLESLKAHGFIGVLIVGKDTPDGVQVAVKMSEGMSLDGVVMLTTAYNHHAANILNRQKEENDEREA